MGVLLADRDRGIEPAVVSQIAPEDAGQVLVNDFRLFSPELT